MKNYRVMLWALLATSGVPTLQAAADQTPPPSTNLGEVGTTEGEQSAVQPSATGDRAQAKERKKEAPNVIEVQPYTEIEKLPDVTIAEALQRVPGISLETDTGEGRFINIRGMDADLNGTTYDGVRLTPSNQASPLGGARAVAFDAFPAGVVGGVEVIKTLTPDIDAEGLGGVVNLLPRSMPKDGSPFVDASIGGGWESLRGTQIWKGDITAGTSFGLTDGTAPWDKIGGGAPGPFSNPRPFSLIATFARYDDARGIDDVEEDYSDSSLPNKALQDLQMRWYQGERERQGGAVEFSFNPDDENSFYIRGLDSGYEEHLDKHRLELDGLDGSNDGGAFTALPSGSFLATSGSAEEKFTNSDELIENQMIVAGGHSVLGDAVKLDYRAAWTSGTDVFPSSYSSTFKGPKGLAITYDNTNPAAITWNAGGVNLADPGAYTLKEVDNSPSDGFDREWSGAIDLTVPLPLAGYDGTLKLGGSARLRTRGTSQAQVTYSPTGTVTAADVAAGGNQIYYNGLYNIGPTISDNALNAVSLVASDPVDDAISNIEAYQHDSENVYAGYAQYTIALDRLEVLGGVRVEATAGRYFAYVGTTDPTGSTTTITPNTNKQNYTNAFPSLQAKYGFSDQLQARLAVSTAIARPGFEQITAAKTIDLSQNTISQGNPGLKPTTGVSFDATVEYYLPNGGIAAFGAFDKEFDNYIVETGAFVPPPAGGSGPFMSSSFKNVSGAQVNGIELSYTQQFAFLPAPLSGLGLDGNYTYNHSRGEIRPGEFEPLPSTSPQNFNAAVFYEQTPLTMRLASSFVSRNMFSVGGDRNTDIFSNPRFRLDFQASYDVTDHITVSFDAKNLTNTRLEFTESQVDSRPIQREFYDQDYLFAVRMRY